MRAPRDPDTILGAWLDDGPTDLPDDTRRAIEVAMRTASQRRAWPPSIWRRTMPGSRTFSPALALAAVAAIVVIVVGVAVATGRPALVGTNATPTPEASPLAVEPNRSVQLDAGRWEMAEGLPFRLTFTVEDGWTGEYYPTSSLIGLFPTEESVTSYPSSERPKLLVSTIRDVREDTCDTGTPTLQGPGSSVTDLANAIAAMESVETTDPAPTSIGGRSGLMVRVTAPDDASRCRNAEFRTWVFAGGEQSFMRPGWTNVVHVVDVEGTPVLVIVEEPPDITEEEDAEIQAIVDTMRLEPAEGDPS